MTQSHLFLLLIVLPAIFAAPETCIASGVCSSACQTRGFKTDGTGNAAECVYPKYDECNQLDSCKSVAEGTPAQACILIGMEKKSNTSDECVLPDISTCTDRNKGKCSNEGSVCKLKFGFAKGLTDDCVNPTNCDKDFAANKPCDAGKACLYLGYEAVAGDKTCKTPAKCEESGKNSCQNVYTVCASTKGFSKKESSDDCECVSPKTIENNKCINKNEYQTSSINLLFSSLSLFILILL